MILNDKIRSVNQLLFNMREQKRFYTYIHIIVNFKIYLAGVVSWCKTSVPLPNVAGVPPHPPTLLACNNQ